MRVTPSIYVVRFNGIKILDEVSRAEYVDWFEKNKYKYEIVKTVESDSSTKHLYNIYVKEVKNNAKRSN